MAMKFKCAECGKTVYFNKSYCHIKPNGERVLGHKMCMMVYAMKHKKEMEQRDKDNAN